MARISTQTRHSEILDLLSEQGEVSVDALSRQFSTSEVTIRKDLRQLEAANQLVRKFGGAVSLPTEIKSESLSEDYLSNRKLSIAEQAASLIPSGARIALDSGSTVLALLTFLEQRNDLVVMTNSLTVANHLTQLDTPPQVLFTGGTWDQQSQAFQGQMAERMLSAYDFDFAFIGAAGIDVERGTTTFNELTNLSKVMAQNAEKVVIMAESNKLNRRIPNVELPWDSISTLITDDAIDPESYQAITQHGVAVIRAQTEEK